MAIQMRRGEYEDFTPEKMLPGEWAVVLDGDPAAETGRSVYICFSAGIVKRIATYEDFEIQLESCMEEVQAEFTEEIRNAIAEALEATEAADKATESAKEATEAAEKAAETGIKSSDVTYQSSMSGTTPPTGEWTTEIPTVDPGGFLWSRMLITYNDGSEKILYAVSKAGVEGGAVFSYDADSKTLIIIA